MMMKIGIEDAPYIRRYGEEKGYECLKNLGYDCVDYQKFLNTNIPLFECSDSEFDAAVVRDRKIIEAAGLEVFQAHAPWRWPAQDATEEDRAERFEKMSKSIRGTALLGCRYFVIHPLMPWGGGSYGPDLQKYRELNLDFMRKLCSVAEKNDVVICFENMPMKNLPLSTPAASLDFVKKVDHPNFKMCLDTGHCTVHGIQPAEAVRLLGKDMLRTLHVHDNDGNQDLHWVPFTGVVDWDDFSKALQEIGFDSCLSIETSPPKKFTGEVLELQDRSLYLSACQIAGK